MKQPILHFFKINSMDIPAWYAPPVTSDICELRTLLHPDLILPILIHLLSWTLSLCGAIFFASFLRELYIEGKNLPFPIQQITVEAIESLTEKREERIDVFATSAVLALVYSFLLYTIPIFTRAIGYTPFPLYPYLGWTLPWTCK